MKAKLYGYWRSSASWRVRWAFELKKIPYEYVPVNILKGEHRAEEHLRRNPMGALPVLETAPGQFVSQSMSQILWLEENFAREPYLFGRDRGDRYKIIELCELINADTAPLQTPRVQKVHSADDAEKAKWAQHFIRAGLEAFEKNLKLLNRSGNYCLGMMLTAADLFLIPQVYNAYRYKIDVDQEFPLIAKIYKHCLSEEACAKASPENQADAQKGL